MKYVSVVLITLFVACSSAPVSTDEPSRGDAGCAGHCTPFAPLGWSDPVLVWRGSVDKAPACPPDAQADIYIGFDDLKVDDLECPTCECGPSIGTCDLPTTIRASKHACDDSPTADFSLDPPENWDGSCAGAHKITAAQGAQSVTINAMSLTESCAPLPVKKAELPPVSWATGIKACAGNVMHGTCANSGSLCTPEPDADWRTCIYHEGDVKDCPVTFPVRHVAFTSVDDSRACSTCTCSGAVAGSSCNATVELHADSTCALPPVNGLIAITSSGPWCAPLPAGQGVAGILASNVQYKSGTCEAGGGEPAGAAEPATPSTFCCIP